MPGTRPVHRLAVTVATVLAGACAHATPPATAVLEQTLASRFPDMKIIDVRPAPVAGLYEIFTADEIVYADASGEHLFVGSLVDTASRRNLTTERLAERRAIDFETLPFERAIKTVKGDGKRRLAVFSDPDCPYCRRLEQELASLADVTIYTFLYPIADLHPQAAARARTIWCSPDRSQAWQQWMLEQKSPVSSACADDPVEELQVLGARLQISGTPTAYLSNGRRIEGARPADELDLLLSAAAAAGDTR